VETRNIKIGRNRLNIRNNMKLYEWRENFIWNVIKTETLSALQSSQVKGGKIPQFHGCTALKNGNYLLSFDTPRKVAFLDASHRATNNEKAELNRKFDQFWNCIRSESRRTLSHCDDRWLDRENHFRFLRVSLRLPSDELSISTSPSIGVIKSIS
jgi:hypothetical protein